MAEQWIEQWVEDVTTADTWAQVVARTWADEAFQARLVADPGAVLREAGLAVPAGLAVQVLETTAPRVAPHADGAHLVLPPKPDVSEWVCERVAEGAGRGANCAWNKCWGCGVF